MRFPFCHLVDLSSITPGIIFLLHGLFPGRGEPMGVGASHSTQSRRASDCLKGYVRFLAPRLEETGELLSPPSVVDAICMKWVFGLPELFASSGGVDGVGKEGRKGISRRAARARPSSPLQSTEQAISCSHALPLHAAASVTTVRAGKHGWVVMWREKTEMRVQWSMCNVFPIILGVTVACSAS